MPLPTRLLNVSTHFKNRYNMKTLKIKIIFLSWIICISNLAYSNQSSNSSDTLLIVTQKQKGYGPFKMAYSLIVDDNYSKSNDPKQTKLKGIPDTLSKIIISTIKFHSKDNNMISSVSVAAGYNSKGDLMYVVDTDNDMDFSNNTFSKAQDIKTTNNEPTQAIIENLLPIKFEHYDNANIVRKDTTWLLIGQPLKPFDGITSLGLSIGEYRKASFDIGDDKIELFLSNGFLFWDYTNPLITILYRNTKNKEFTSITKNEFIISNGKCYKFIGCTQDGSNIILTKVENINQIQGTQIGLKSKDFEIKDDKNHIINLESVKGKYVLLDFWATWCSGCIKELPVLKDAYAKYNRKDFEILGVAVDDSAKVGKFIRDKEITWLNSLATMNSKIVTDFNVSVFPTMILIDRIGRIVAKGQHIDLINELDKLIKKEK
jgi:peroxiredoxin